MYHFVGMLAVIAGALLTWPIAAKLSWGPLAALASVVILSSLCMTGFIFLRFWLA